MCCRRVVVYATCVILVDCLFAVVVVVFVGAVDTIAGIAHAIYVRAAVAILMCMAELLCALLMFVVLLLVVLSIGCVHYVFVDCLDNVIDAGGSVAVVIVVYAVECAYVPVLVLLRGVCCRHGLCLCFWCRRICVGVVVDVAAGVVVVRVAVSVVITGYAVGVDVDHCVCVPNSCVDVDDVGVTGCVGVV